jgi:glycosyltransferase involved in cell wall biosynthesis
MKILHIIGSMDPVSGGPCQGIRNSNPEMVRLGSSREVVSLDDPKASFLGADDFPIHALGPAKGPWQYTAKLKPWLIANISRFDVVIINGLWIYSSYTGWKVLRLLKKQKKQNIPRLFVMPHGMLDPYFQRIAGRRLKAIRNWLYWLLIERNVVNDADGVLFTCETELQLARKTFNTYNPQKEINVGYGILPPPAFTENMLIAFSEKCPGLNQQPYFLFFSRIHQKKGVDLLINAYLALMGEATRDGKSIPRLVIAGPGLNTPFGKKMLKLVSAHPELHDAVFFTGMLTGDAKWGALYGCDAFVLPSHQENFGIAVVEAMACKKPVLISNQINIWIEIKEGGGGIVVPDTIEGTKSMLTHWLKLSPAQKEQMGLQALNVFENYFHIEPTSASFLKAING